MLSSPLRVWRVVCVMHESSICVPSCWEKMMLILFGHPEQSRGDNHVDMTKAYRSSGENKRLHRWVSVVMFRSLPLYVIPCNSLCGGCSQLLLIVWRLQGRPEKRGEEEARNFLSEKKSVTISEMLRDVSLLSCLVFSFLNNHFSVITNYSYTLWFYMCRDCAYFLSVKTSFA